MNQKSDKLISERVTSSCVKLCSAKDATRRELVHTQICTHTKQLLLISGQKNKVTGLAGDESLSLSKPERRGPHRNWWGYDYTSLARK